MLVLSAAVFGVNECRLDSPYNLLDPFHDRKKGPSNSKGDVSFGTVIVWVFENAGGGEILLFLAFLAVAAQVTRMLLQNCGNGSRLPARLILPGENPSGISPFCDPLGGKALLFDWISIKLDLLALTGRW